MGGSFTAVTPNKGAITTATPANTSVVVASPPIMGCYIWNPLTAADQGIATAEVLYVDPTGVALPNNGTTVALQPGQSWSGIPGSTSPVAVLAPTNNHRFACVRW